MADKQWSFSKAQVWLNKASDSKKLGNGTMVMNDTIVLTFNIFVGKDDSIFAAPPSFSYEPKEGGEKKYKDHFYFLVPEARVDFNAAACEAYETAKKTPAAPPSRPGTARTFKR